LLPFMLEAARRELRQFALLRDAENRLDGMG
jgi:hypothetical protein